MGLNWGSISIQQGFNWNSSGIQLALNYNKKHVLLPPLLYYFLNSSKPIFMCLEVMMDKNT